jgi:hypothetical protein
MIKETGLRCIKLTKRARRYGTKGPTTKFKSISIA